MLELRYEEVARLFTYDRETGVLYWRIRVNNNTRRYWGIFLEGQEKVYSPD